MKRIEPVHSTLPSFGIVFFYICIINGCQSVNQPDIYQIPQDVRDVIPLAEGNTYSYQKTFCYYDTTCSSTLYGRRITKEISANGKKMYIVDDWMGVETMETVDGVSYNRYFRPWSGAPMKSIILLATPIEKGTTWKISDWDSSGTYSTSVTITAVDVPFVSAGKQYDHTIIVESTPESPAHFKYCFVPGIGIVYEFIEYPKYSGWILSQKFELTNYKLEIN